MSEIPSHGASERPFEPRPQPGDAPQNALHERYASREMAALFSPRYRYLTWRRLWIALADSQRELGLPYTERQIRVLTEVAPNLDLARVAEIEAQTRHDVVAHVTHFKEQADALDAESGAGGILHAGATSAFITDNTDALIIAQALELLEGRLAATLRHLANFARRWTDLPCLAYTHFQPAQLTTVGKRASLWAQDWLMDFEALRDLRSQWRCRGAKGTTGTQASYHTLFGGDETKIRALDSAIAHRLGFAASFPITGQTYPRKQDSRALAVLAGLGESAHKMGTDLRLLQGVGELSEPFGKSQVGSSAMAYKRNPIRAERMCALARRLITDSLNGPLNTAVNWLERSLDDSANRRLVLTDAFLCADAVVGLAGYIAEGLTVREATIAARVDRELPFMATETLMMRGVLQGGDRQVLHEVIRVASLAAQEQLAAGGENSLIPTLAKHPDFPLGQQEIEDAIDPTAFVGRSPGQVEEFLTEHLEPALEGVASVDAAAPRV